MNRKQETEMLAIIFNGLNSISVKGQSDVKTMAACIEILGNVLASRQGEEPEKDQDC